MKTSLITTLVGILVGASAGYSWQYVQSTAPTAKDPEPLYWVAPMDPNYRRDAPGKSPMGMDLVPVYATGSPTGNVAQASNSPGTVTISPHVENNLGVRTTEVEHRQLNNQIITVGFITFDEDKLVHVHPRIAGWIDRLYIKAKGEQIDQGAPLYSLYSPELVNAQEELLLALEQGNSLLVDAAETRLRALHIPDSFVRDLKRQRQIAQRVTFYSPHSGVIANLNIREGFYVEPGTTLMSIGALDQVWVEAQVFARQASLVKVHDPASMTLDYYPGQTWNGKVDYIYPTLDTTTRTLRVRLRFSNPDQALKPNMFAQVTLSSQSSQSLPAVPNEAVIRTGTQNKVVLALGDGRYKSVNVTLGHQDNQYTQIKEGLRIGDQVVTSAQFLLDSESSITSDFKRIDQEGSASETVWVDAKIIRTMPEYQMLKAEHGPVAAWDWPAMTMDFYVSDQVDMTPLQPGTQLNMAIRADAEGDYEIMEIKLISQPPQEENNTEVSDHD